jgi:hypothetical protein
MLALVNQSRSRRSTMTFLRRALAGLVVGALGALAAVGLYAEATRTPDQP